MVGAYKKTVGKISSSLKDGNISGFLFWVAAPMLIGILGLISYIGFTILTMMVLFFIGDFISEQVLGVVGTAQFILSYLLAVLAVIDLWRNFRK